MKMLKLFITSSILVWCSSLFATMSISANSAVIDKANNIIVYSGEVEFRAPELTIMTEELVVESLSVEKKSYQITATSTDKVSEFEMLQKSTSARAKRIVYTTDLELVTLLEDAVINQDGNILKGEHITYDILNNNAKVKGTKGKKVRFELDM